MLFLGSLMIPLLSASGQSKDKKEPQAARVRVENGILEGITEPSAIRSFKGIPFARPPIGELRWREPMPAENWTGVRKADHFGPRAMQRFVFGDMRFRSDSTSEDCLYLNVWTPSSAKKLPVLVYFYGGGFVAGDGSEYRYDGEKMAQKGIVAVTVNYRLGVFGFLAHPELSKESPHHASGNYGLLDQNAALRWVKRNISAFGGDPDRITIAGESAGSISVSAQMASPLSKNLIKGAIGESGALINPTFSPVPLVVGEKTGETFMEKAGAKSLGELRAIPAQKLLDISYSIKMPSMPVTVDGYFLTKAPADVFSAGEQAKVPLLVGWNSAESSYQSLLQGNEPTPDNYRKAIQQQYPDQAEEILKYYPAVTKEQVIQSATALAGDRFIAFSTWKWWELHRKTSGKPVYRYLYSHPRPAQVSAGSNTAATETGASHSAEIEYALGNLVTNNVYAWTAADYKISSTLQDYFANFIKTGNPNGKGLPQWPVSSKNGVSKYINIDLNTKAEDDRNYQRYLFLDSNYSR